MDIIEGIKHVIDGNGMLFIGAGFSRDATNLIGKKMSLASEFSANLCNELDIPPDGNLSKISNIYLENNASQDLINRLLDNYTCRTIKNHHKIIAKLPWKRIYTTNYDDVFERASIENGKRRRSVIISDNIKKTDKKNIIFHINGYINKLTKEMLNNEFKLTSTSYLVEDFTKSPWSSLFRSDINNCRAIFFIGSSFDYDIDLQRIFYANSEIKDKIIFIDKKLTEDEENNKYLNYYKNLFGTVQNIGVKRFGEIVEQVRETYNPKSQSLKFNCFRNLNTEEYPFKDVITQDIWNLLSYGQIEDSLIYHNIDNQKYIIRRNLINNIINSVKEKNPKVIIIHSDLGNGKTCSARLLAQSLRLMGNVFFFSKDLDYIDEEIEKIDEFKGSKFIIIENYNYHLNVLKKFKSFISEEYCFILTVRSYVNESVSYKIRDILEISESEIYEFSTNKIEDKDIDNIIGLLDRTELWQEFKNLPPTMKRKQIKEEYGGSFREILLDLVNSSKISGKVIDIYTRIEKSQTSKDILLAVFINSLVGLNLNLDDIIKYLELYSIPNNIKKDEDLNELINIDNNTINAKSSILATYLITNQKLQSDMIRVMKKMVHTANMDIMEVTSLTVRKALISISNIWEILQCNSETVKDEILQYYDEVKDYDDYKNNPYFWLQYAIACLDVKEYFRAQNYFEIAYREGNNKSLYNDLYEFDTFQIDTQYARFLLEYNIFGCHAEDPMKIITEAHSLLIKTLNKNKGQKHYVFRQVGYYHRFFVKYKNNLDNKGKNTIINYCKEMNKRIDKYIISREGRDFNTGIKKNKELLDRCIKDVLYSVAQ